MGSPPISSADLLRGLAVEVEHRNRRPGHRQPSGDGPPYAARRPVTIALRPVRSTLTAEAPGATEVSSMLSSRSEKPLPPPAVPVYRPRGPGPLYKSLTRRLLRASSKLR